MKRLLWMGMVGVCMSVSATGCRRTAPGTVVVVGPPSLEAQLRTVAAPLKRNGRTLDLRVARLDERSLDGADIAVAQSAAGLSPVAEALTGTRVSFACSDEVVLVGAQGEPPRTLAEVVLAADTVVLADPRGAGAGEAGEAALSRAGLRVKAATKLRYVPQAEDVLRAVGPGAVGLVMRSDVSRGAPSGVAILASGFDGARDCPTAAALAKAPHPELARDLLALLARSSTSNP